MPRASERLEPVTRRTYTSSRERLLRLGELGPFFEGKHAMQVFGWTSKTTAQYLWGWAKQGLIRQLGGKSDIFFNLVAHPGAEAHLEAAIRTAMPGATVGARTVLHAAGVTTQRPGRLNLLVRPGERRLRIDAAEIEARPPRWWAAIDLTRSVAPATEVALARLRTGAALADAASTGAIAPDDVGFDQVPVSEAGRAIRLLKLLDPAPGKTTSLESAYRRVWEATIARGTPA